MKQKRRALTLGILLASTVLAGCRREEAPPSLTSNTAGANAMTMAPAAASANSLAAKPGVTNRKIIRQAELELEVAGPGTTQTAIERLAEQHGGYVVSASRNIENGSAIDVRVTVVVRVPQAELMSTIGELKRMGRGVGSERITSDDVTDEYLDSSARIITQKQLEQQYLEILKRAVTVKDAMEVQKELAEVRTEIERMQGRQQLLEKESAFSTLTVHLTAAVPQLAVTSTGFSGTIWRAWSDAIELSADMISGGIRLVGLLLPVFVLVVLPCGLLFLAVRRGGRKRRAALLAP